MVGILELDIMIYESNSLKEKRMVIRSLIDSLRAKHNISIAETDFMDKWNRSIITLALVSNDKKIIEIILDNMLLTIENDHRLEVLSLYREII